MNTIPILVLAAVVTAMAAPALALPPRPHRFTGTVVEFDPARHVLTVAPSRGSKPPLVLEWDKSTRTCGFLPRSFGCCLAPGKKVGGYYRLLPGRKALRSVRCSL